MTLNRPEAVIFDMDGVIFDSENLCLECWTKLAKKHGLEGMREAFLRCTGTNVTATKQKMMEYYGEDFEYDEFAREASKLFHEEEDINGLPMKPYICELLMTLKERNIPIGLASSTRYEAVVKELKDAGIYEYFQVVVGGDLLEKSKPEPDIYLMACKEMKVNPENSIAIEDSFNGIRSAYAANMIPIMIPDLIPPDDEMKVKSVKIYEDLSAFVTAIENEFCW